LYSLLEHAIALFEHMCVDECEEWDGRLHVHAANERLMTFYMKRGFEMQKHLWAA
jgi:GNAT superfamily N-acetyltransferase